MSKSCWVEENDSIFENIPECTIEEIECSDVMDAISQIDEEIIEQYKPYKINTYKEIRSPYNKRTRLVDFVDDKFNKKITQSYTIWGAIGFSILYIPMKIIGTVLKRI